MIIRNAILEDRKDLLSLYTDFLETDRFSEPANDSFLEIIRNDNNYILVAEDDSSIVGFITASKRWVVRYPNPIMQIDELYVDPDFRKHGVGKKLIQGIEELARKERYERIYVESAYKHTLGHRFYETNGYKKSGFYFLKLV